MTLPRVLSMTSAQPSFGKSLYEGLGPQSLALFRIYLLGYWLIEISRSTLPRLATFDPHWYSPHGLWVLTPASLRDLMFGAVALHCMKWVTLLGVVWMLLGLPGRRGVSYVNLFLLLLFTSFLRGFGHPDHSHVQIFLVTVVLSFSPAWDVWSVSRTSQASCDPSAVPPPQYGQSFAAMALIFSLPYFATGVYRLAKEGLGIFLGASMQHFLARDSLVLDDFAFSAGLWIVEHQVLLPVINLSFFLVTLAELGAPFAHLKRGYCTVFLTVILPFHLLAPLLMHILFLQNIVVILGLYLGPLVLQTFRPLSPAKL